MKLYYFNPNSYGLQWFVVSDSEENAIKALNEFFANNEEPYMAKFKWVDGQLTEPSKYSEDGIHRYKHYTIDVYEPNQVLDSEIA